MDMGNYSFEKFCKIIVGALFFAICLPLLARAEIKYPYVVDEKSPVTFGDSIASSTYYGLENYSTDYVNGFAHITFTYTHHQCCFASNPPIIYVTNVDPRTTNTPIEKWVAAPYQIPAFNGIPTDWYSYDIQFDATGFRTIVKQASTTEIYNVYQGIDELVETNWVALTNRHPNYAPDNTESMSFTPLPIKETPPETTINPVIIIPGIMGSARKNGELVIDPILHTYDDLIETLDQNGYTKEVDLFTFPYEWRDSNIQSADLLKEKIDEIKDVCLSHSPPNTDCTKVDLVAHSMGGLVARSYIQSNAYQNDVDQLIFLGTPHKGSPKAYLQWEGGAFTPGLENQLQKQFFVSEAHRNGYSTLYDYINSRPISSVRELLPIFPYLKDKDTGNMRVYPNEHPQNTFLRDLNSDISNLLAFGNRITNIVGSTGSDNTIEIIRVGQNSSPLWAYGKPDGFDGESTDRGLENGIGDGTVTMAGTTLDPTVPNDEWTGVAHGKLPRETSGRIFNILTGDIAETVIIKSLIEKIFSIQLQSPIDVVVTAPDGKRMGKNFANEQEYNEIPDAFYSGYGTEEEYITIPNPLDGEYKIEVQGTEGGGKYGILTSYISEEFSTTTETTGITEPYQITKLEVLIDNESPEDLATEREVTLEVLTNDVNGAYNLGWITDKKVRDSLIKQAKLIIKFEKKRNGKYETKVDKILIKLLEKELELLKKKGRINQQAFDLLKTDLNYLINNN